MGSSQSLIVISIDYLEIKIETSGYEQCDDMEAYKNKDSKNLANFEFEFLHADIFQIQTKTRVLNPQRKKNTQNLAETRQKQRQREKHLPSGENFQA